MSGAPSHADLCAHAARWLRRRFQCRAVFSEMACDYSTPDVIGWDSGARSFLIEAKVSRSDFRRDWRKLPRRHQMFAVGMFRHYFVPKGLLTPEEVPEGWGLAEVRGSRVYLLKEAPFHQLDPIAERLERKALVSALARHQNGLPYDIATGRYAPYSALTEGL